MDSKNFNREDYLLLAKMAQQTERHQEMLEYVQKFLKFDAELTAEERSIVSATYKNVVGNKRAELRVLTAIKQREERKANETHINFIKNYEKIIEGELRQLCNEILTTLEKNLIPNCKAMDSKVFYFKMIGDYNRYLAEFLLDQEHYDAANKAEQAYREAEILSRNHLPPTNPIRLGLQLNLSVFLFEILLRPDEAKKVANAAFEEAITNIDNVNEENYKDCTLIMQLLKDNLTLWSNEMYQDEGQTEEI